MRTFSQPSVFNRTVCEEIKNCFAESKAELSKYGEPKTACLALVEKILKILETYKKTYPSYVDKIFSPQKNTNVSQIEAKLSKVITDQQAVNDIAQEIVKYKDSRKDIVLTESSSIRYLFLEMFYISFALEQAGKIPEKMYLIDLCKEVKAIFKDQALNEPTQSPTIKC